MEPINRKLLKENAKKALKRNFWLIMLVCICATFLDASFNGLNAGSGSYAGSVNKVVTRLGGGVDVASGHSFSDFYDYGLDESDIADEIKYDWEYALDNLEDKLQDSFGFMQGMDAVSLMLVLFAVVCVVVLVIYVISLVISFLIGSFLGAPISVGYQRFFMLNRLNRGKLSDLFAAFGKNRYMNIVKTMFRTNIEIFLWRLLFYFPGLVKTYEYFFVGYIMAENPNIDAKRAKQLSKEMSNGHKWQIFVLQLSFLGWTCVFALEFILLTVFSCGFLSIPAMLLIYPLVGYQAATYAELYEERREYALVTNMAGRDELIGFDFGETV